jgi:hypothetical protein
MEIRTDGRIEYLIGAAVMAGAYASLARHIPESARSLCEMRDKWSARTAMLANGICDEAGVGAPASVAMRHPKG